MKFISALLVASAALTSAQVVYNETTGTFICPASAPNGAFCAGNSQETNIIIRCTNGIGRPGNCNDNLAGRPPFGVRFSPCFATTPTAGDAACSRNCIVYPENGTAPFTIPGCTPTYTSTTLTSTTTVSHNSTTTTTTYVPPTTTSYPNTTTTTHIPPTTTSYPNTTTITYVHPSPPTTFVPSGTGIFTPPVNGTTLQPTRTPVGPTSVRPTEPPQFTGAADKNTINAFAGVLAFAALFMM